MNVDEAKILKQCYALAENSDKSNLEVLLAKFLFLDTLFYICWECMKRLAMHTAARASLGKENEEKCYWKIYFVF